MRKIISLHGEWRFALDPATEGLHVGWYSHPLPARTSLPGATGVTCPAWYQRDIDIPADWVGCYTSLLLERTTLTRVWVDGADSGAQDSLSTPHRYDLGLLAPGPHTLSIMVDNASQAPPGDARPAGEQPRINWNGILGRIELQRLEPVFIDDVQVYPDVAARQAIVRARIGNRSSQPVFAGLGLKAWGWNDDVERPCSETQRHTGLPPGAPDAPAMRMLEARLPLGVSSLVWDEFNPRFYRLLATLQTRGIGDQVETAFGLCEFGPRGAQLAVNGRPTLLRGQDDMNLFPANDPMPMDAPAWLRAFERARADGFNCVRFHGGCPPEAAFVAADQLGHYLQPGLPNPPWLGSEARDAYLRLEGERILREYGNHPSFVMFAVGDEADLLRHFRAFDNRRLYDPS